MNTINSEVNFTSLPAYNSYLIRPRTNGLNTTQVSSTANEVQSNIYEKACRQLQKLGLDKSIFTIGFSKLLNAGADNKKINLWTETFIYLESKGLESGYYTGAFIELIQTFGITFNELKLFACASVALIENDLPIDELKDNVINTLKRDDRPQREQEAWIREHCSQASMQAGSTYETRRDRIKKNVVGAVLATIIKAPFLIFRILG